MEQTPRGARRVAFFGGSFDPPHQGHLAVARAARMALGLDSVLFAPVGIQPLKPEGPTASFEDRLEMTRLAIAGEPGFAVSQIDAPKPSDAPNYTLETLLRLREELPSEGALFCLMGADSFFGLRRWDRSAEIPFVSSLIVASRPGQPLDDLRVALPHGLTLEPSPEPRMAPANGSGLTDLDSPAAGVEVRTFLLSNPGGETSPFYLLPGLHVEISASKIRDWILKDASSGGASPGAESPGFGKQPLPVAVLDYIRSHRLYR
jgi:nicotinate-nucleotide adenylyltransferase